MSEWVLVPSLVTLRTEFNEVAPNRKKGADGAIGDSSHNSSSDHTPDEDSDVLRDHDADDKNEVHALDVTSAGPWPGEVTTQKQRFDRLVKKVIATEKAKWLDGKDKCRLNYVIWDSLIYDKDNDFEPVLYSGRKKDPHTNHAHFSARYETPCENDTRPYGLLGDEDDMLKDDIITLTADTAKELGLKAGDKRDAATLLQLAVIFAARGDDKADTAVKGLAAQDLRLKAIETLLNQVSDPSASAEQIAAVLKATLGSRAGTVGALLQK